MTHRPAARSVPRPKLLLWVLAAVQFTHILDFMIVMPLGPHLMRVFGISPTQFSWLVAAYGVAAALAGFFAGFVMDRFDRRTALLVLYAGFGLSTLACALAPTYGALLGARFAAGAFGGVAGSVVGSMVGDVIEPGRRGRAMAVVMSAFPLASILGVPAGLTLAAHFDWPAPFFLIAGVALVVFTVAHRTVPSLRAEHPVAHPFQQMRAILSFDLHQRGFLMSAMLVFSGSCVIPFMAPSMVANVGLTEAQLSLIYLAGGLATLVSTPVLGRLTDRFDKLHVLSAISVTGAIVVWVMTRLTSTSIFVAMLMTAFFMITMSGRFSPAMAMLTNAVDARYRGGFMSVNSAVQQAAGGLANIVAGFFITRAPSGQLQGYSRVGLLSIACLGLTLFLAARLRAVAPHAARSTPDPLPTTAA
jgi:predicted MFS family arabinose efflux permease